MRSWRSGGWSQEGDLWIWEVDGADPRQQASIEDPSAPGHSAHRQVCSCWLGVAALEFFEVFPNLQKINSRLFILKSCWQDGGSYSSAIWLLKWELEEQRWGEKGPQSSWCCWDWWRKLESAETLPEGSLPPPPHPHSDMVTPAVSWWFLPLELTASHWSQGKPPKLSVWSSAPNPSLSSRRRARPQCSCAPEGWGAQEESGRQTSCFCFPEASPAPGDAAEGRGESAEQAAEGVWASPTLGPLQALDKAGALRGLPAHAEGRAPEPADASFWRFQPSLFRAPHTGPRALWDTGQVTASRADVGCHGTQGQTWFKEVRKGDMRCPWVYGRNSLAPQPVASATSSLKPPLSVHPCWLCPQPSSFTPPLGFAGVVSSATCAVCADFGSLFWLRPQLRPLHLCF